MAKKKNKKRNKRIGTMSQTRAMWERKPQTQVVPNKKRKNDRKRVKEKIRQGIYD